MSNYLKSPEPGYWKEIANVHRQLHDIHRDRPTLFQPGLYPKRLVDGQWKVGDEPVIIGENTAYWTALRPLGKVVIAGSVCVVDGSHLAGPYFGELDLDGPGAEADADHVMVTSTRYSYATVGGRGILAKYSRLDELVSPLLPGEGPPEPEGNTGGGIAELKAMASAVAAYTRGTYKMYVQEALPPTEGDYQEFHNLMRLGLGNAQSA